jgi:hypothetical protein
MWESQSLTILWASTACYTDSFYSRDNIDQLQANERRFTFSVLLETKIALIFYFPSNSFLVIRKWCWIKIAILFLYWTCDEVYLWELPQKVKSKMFSSILLAIPEAGPVAHQHGKSTNTNRIWRQLHIQDLCFPICKLLFFTHLHRILQGMNS